MEAPRTRAGRNHEFYSHRFERTIRGARRIYARISPHLIVLLDASFDIPGTDIRVTGTTLWTHMSYRVNIADFAHILGWTVDENNRAHRKAVHMLRRALDRARTEHVVLTHHSPLEYAPGFATNLACVVARASRWGYGHTHASSADRIEFYGHTYGKVISRVRKVCSDVSPKLVFLHNSHFDVPDTNIRVFGSTFWTNVEYDDGALDGIADIANIKKWSVNAHNAAHRKALATLERSAGTRTLVVMSHHAPIAGHPAFGTDLREVIERHSVRAWFYGHDHVSRDFYIGDCRVVSNQLGYTDEKRTGFERDAAVYVSKV